MASFQSIFPFWSNLWSPIRGGLDGLRRVAGIQYNSPTQLPYDPSVPITEETAMQIGAVWSCVRLLSNAVAGLPISATKVTGRKRKELDDHWFVTLMKRPNRYNTQVEFFNSLMLNLILQGNAYCKITRIGGKIVDLTPMFSAQVQVKLEMDGSKTYIYNGTDGVQEHLKESQVWHIKQMGNGIIGKSVLEHARGIFGSALAQDKTISNVFKNGGKRSGALSAPTALTPDQRQAIKDNYGALTGGAEGDRLLVLENGMEFSPIAMTPADVELLESRRFSVEEICRLFQVPSILVNASNPGHTASSTEQIMSSFYKTGLAPYLNLIESSIQRWLLDDKNNEDKDVLITFDLDTLLRGDLKTRSEYYRNGISGSFLSPNEARAMENLPPVEGGDDILCQLGFGPLKMLEESMKNRGSSGGFGGPEAKKPDENGGADATTVKP